MLKSEFFLKGYSIENPVAVNWETVSLSIESDKRRIDKLSLLRKSLETDSETAILKINCPSSKYSSLELAIDVVNLLSIALGKRIIFDRQIYWNDSSFEELKKNMVKNYNMGEQIIPDFEIQSYLHLTLANWRKLQKKVKDEVFIITDYLNQTKYGFIEDRVLRAFQAWECAATFWIEKIELTDDLKVLRNKLKNTFNEWKEEYNFNDNGELLSSILLPFKEKKTILKINELVLKYKLNEESFSLELKTLKTLRDQVAHNGRIDKPGAEVINIIEPSVFGLQLLLLKMLGYDGLVCVPIDGKIRYEKLKMFFK